jgi:hypothetical protein
MMSVDAKTERIRSLEADNQRLQQRVEELEEALRPFSEYAVHFADGSGRDAWEDQHDAGYFMNYRVKPDITVGDYRNARRLLSPKEQP